MNTAGKSLRNCSKKGLVGPGIEANDISLQKLQTKGNGTETLVQFLI